MRANFGLSDHALFLRVLYTNQDGQYSRTVWQGCHHCIQGYNNNNSVSKFQSVYKEGLEGHGIKITGIKQAQIMNEIVEGIERRE